MTADKIRLLLDTNDVDADNTRNYLLADSNHQVVLSDAVWMEMLKSGAVQQLHDQLTILREFPDRVEILRPFGECMAIDSNSADLAGQLVDKHLTASFPNQLAIVSAAAGGNLAALKRVEGWQLAASKALTAIQAKTVGIEQSLAFLEGNLSSSDIKHIRRGEPLTSQLSTKVVELTIDQAYLLWENFGRRAPEPVGAGIINSPIFRLMLVKLNTAIHFLGTGAPTRKRKQVENDLIDSIVATLGTYFHGVLSSDMLTNRIHAIARAAIILYGGYIAGDYMRYVDRSQH